MSSHETEKCGFLFLYIIDYFHTEDIVHTNAADSPGTLLEAVTVNPQTMEIDFKYKTISIPMTMNRRGNSVVFRIKNDQILLKKRFSFDLIHDVLLDTGTFKLKHKDNLDSFLKTVAHQIKDDIDHLSGPATASNHSSMETVSRHQQQLMDDLEYVAIYEDLKKFPPKIGE